MSILQTLRERAGWLVAAVIGVALLIFVVSDFFSGNTGNQRKARKYYEIATIGNESVSYQEYEARIQNLIEIYKLSGTPNITEELTETIRYQIWEQMVREKVLGKEFKKVGLEVSSDEIDALVLGENKHPIVLQLFSDPETGIFNESILINFLKGTEIDASAKAYWLFFEDEIVTDRINTKYNTLAAKGLNITRFQADFERQLAAKSVDFTYTGQYFNTLPDTLVTVTSDEIRKYYSARKDEYSRPARRSMEYVTFDIVPSEEDFQVGERWINETLEEFKTSTEPEQFINLTSDTRHVGFYYTVDQLPESLRAFAEAGDKSVVFGPYLEDNYYKIARIIDIAERPDSVRARHILITPAVEGSMSAAREKADSLLNVIRGGMSFELMAMISSEDKGSAQVGGDLGWFPEGMMVVPFNNACFSAPKGELLTVETSYGVHIIEILDQSRKVRKYNMGIIDREVTPGSSTIQKIYGEASMFAANNPTYEKFSLTVAEQGLNKKIATDLAPEQKEIAGLDNPRYLVMSLFETGQGKIVLDNSQQAVFEIGDKYVIAYCTKVQEEGIAALKDVESDIRYKLVNEKKADLIAEKFKAQSGEGKTVESIAREMNLRVEEATSVTFRSYTVPGTAGIEPALISAASSAPAGKLAGPVKGTNGVYMFIVNNVTPLETEDFDMVMDRLTSMIGIRASYELFEALRKEAGIVDKRYRFF
ncbi:MAG: SurA N-terminal domain-containing protein [Bacteroidales bacterium]|jgi:peptidyl-prolyl cis-trans isomerase D|nr:SurA N-terminal domain-containing protein [Bacteroidales bacterium]